MNRRVKSIVIIALILVLTGLLIRYAPQYLTFMKPAPPGIHGLYSSDYDPVYKTTDDKDSLLHDLEREGILVKSGRLHDYDPPWDSLRYVIGNIRCDTQLIEPYIEFFRGKQEGFTSFRILWINAAPNKSYDTTLYNNLTKKYYDCFEAILSRHGVQYK